MAAAVALTSGVLPAMARHAAATTDTLVTVGSPTTTFSQNKQNEPAVAVDANHPSILAAGANDNIDLEACNAGAPTTCPFTPGVGVSGIYFSMDSGKTWTQPTYHGLTARGCLGPAACTPTQGNIGTVPNYFEAGLASGGDPALAFGPVPGPDGMFSWANGSRLYYANLTSNLSTTRDEATFQGFEAVAVSRTDDVASAAAGNNGAWMAPVISSKQSSTTFSDKEQLWADNAQSSPFFGNVYICNAAFRSQEKGHAVPAPIIVSTSQDGGSTWTQQQVTPSVNNSQHPGQSGCTIRTDSHGVVYVFAQEFGPGQPGTGSHLLIKSLDGGKTFSTPQRIFSVTDNCVFFDPVLARCVMDGIAGARDDLAASPSVDIANGAPSGTGATNEIVDTWADGRDGINHEHVFVSASTDGGGSWTSPRSIESAGDRGYYSAAAISPTGDKVYVVYNAFDTFFQTTTSTARSLVGVVKTATVSGGSLGAFGEVNRGATGDPRASSQNNLAGEFLGDYVYAAATSTYGIGVWNDTRGGADCPPIDAWRQSLRTSPGSVARPSPNADCPSTFGNSDIFSFTTA
jgi:hypothetical protein